MLARLPRLFTDEVSVRTPIFSALIASVCRMCATFERGMYQWQDYSISGARIRSSELSRLSTAR